MPTVLADQRRRKPAVQRRAQLAVFVGQALPYRVGRHSVRRHARTAAIDAAGQKIELGKIRHGVRPAPGGVLVGQRQRVDDLGFVGLVEDAGDRLVGADDVACMIGDDANAVGQQRCRIHRQRRIRQLDELIGAAFLAHLRLARRGVQRLLRALALAHFDRERAVGLLQLGVGQRQRRVQFFQLARVLRLKRLVRLGQIAVGLRQLPVQPL